MQFRWNRWNVEHIATHGVRPKEAEAVVRKAAQPFPLWRPDDKWLVWGRGSGSRLLQVVFVLDHADSVYVIHARPLTPSEKRRYRTRSKSQ